MKEVDREMKFWWEMKHLFSVLLFLFGSMGFIEVILPLNTVSATADSIIDEINITVPISCTLTGVGMDTHNAEIQNGQINSAIGETTMKAYCNDKDGFGIYAIGYTDDIDGKNVLTNSAIDPVNDIVTGTATGPVSNVDTSNWAMKLSTITSPTPTYPITIQNNYNSFHRVPEYYELVAKRDTANDVGGNAEGSTFKTTYQAYISNSQLAGTYVGQVKYTLVHPSTNYVSAFDITYNANTEDTVTDLPAEQLGESTNGVATLSSTKPVREDYGFYGWCTTVPTGPNCSGTTYRAGKDYPIAENSTNQVTLYAIWGTYSELDTGTVVNGKMKSLAAGTDTTYSTATSDIKAIRMANSLPTGFTPSTENTISVSEIPTYIWYDNTNDAGIIYVYTSADKVRLSNANMLFEYNNALTDISGVANWDTQNVKGLGFTFSATDVSSVSALANWDTSSVTSMVATFKDATNLSDISGLSSWDTSKVVSIGSLFRGATSLTSVSALVNWDTSKITTMAQLFYDARSLSDIDGLSNWNTSKVSSMANMFRDARSLSDISGLRKWDTSGVTNMSNMFWNTPSLIDFSPFSKWDTASVQDMGGMFGLYYLTKTNNEVVDLTPLADWDVGNVTTMNVMFQNVNLASFWPLRKWNVGAVRDFSYTFSQSSNTTPVVTSLSGLENWNVSSATSVGYMFGYQRALTDASAINNWDITNVRATAGDASTNNYFYDMFIRSSVYPNFTKRAGVWNSEGTFIPSE